MKAAEGSMTISQEEIEIRRELEAEIERGLEKEIKDEIYRLAIRLHQFYQKKQSDEPDQSKTTLSDVKISITIKGGKIEFKQTKKESHDEKGRPRTADKMKILNIYHQQAMLTNNDKFKRFDWEKSLRSSRSIKAK
ncbi:hypothetical protein ACFE04_019307 [Oxalis oulophora]